jgi:hypothetical protein
VRHLTQQEINETEMPDNLRELVQLSQLNLLDVDVWQGDWGNWFVKVHALEGTYSTGVNGKYSRKGRVGGMVEASNGRTQFIPTVKELRRRIMEATPR